MKPVELILPELAEAHPSGTTIEVEVYAGGNLINVASGISLESDSIQVKVPVDTALKFVVSTRFNYAKQIVGEYSFDEGANVLDLRSVVEEESPTDSVPVVEVEIGSSIPNEQPTSTEESAVTETVEDSAAVEQSEAAVAVEGEQAEAETADAVQS